MIRIAARAAPERVPELVEHFRQWLGVAAGWELDDAFATLVHALAPNDQPTLAALWDQLPASTRDTQADLLGRLRLGRRVSLAQARAAAHGQPIDRALSQALLDANLARPFHERFAEPWTIELFAMTNDTFSTNTHFTFTVVQLVDRIVRGVVDE